MTERERAPRPPTVIVVGAEDHGRPIEKALARRFAWSQVAKLLRQGRVRTGERRLARGEQVERGQEVVVVHGEGRPPPPPMPNRRLRVAVVHEEPELAVVLKPAGLAVHPGPGHGTDTLLNALVARYPELVALGADRGWGLVHRLDRDTSGLLVVARTAGAHEALVRAFAERRVSKEYLALVAGAPAPPAGEVTAPVDGKEALTRYETLERAAGASLVRAWPVTGRTHQVRAHLAHAGAPVLGDGRYGGAARFDLPRLALHAAKLALPHPTTGAPLSFEAPLPPDLQGAWRRLQAGGGG